MKYIHFLGDSRPNIAKHGGKGYSLIRLLQYDFVVPQGFIITTNAFKEFFRNRDKTNRWLKLLSSGLQSKEIFEVSKKIQKMISNLSIPNAVKTEVKTALNLLKNKSEKGTRFAVRSSATIEDSEKASFAGQADTYLFRNTYEEIIESIKKCWNSLFSPRSLLYVKQLHKKGINIDLKDILMAVIIQKMVNPDISGVLFTTNILNKNFNQMLINSTWGLGEPIANNTVVPDTIIIEKRTCKIIKTLIGKKEKIAIPDYQNSCTKYINPEINEVNKCSLEPYHIKKLHDLGLKVEEKFTSPQDIEWAIENENLYILQTRSITTLN